MMAAFSPKFKRALRKAGRLECCEVCGWKVPRLANKGLDASHIVSKNSGGPERVDNVIVLCPRCAVVFDRFLKPAIAKAFKLCNQNKQTKYATPKDWATAEGMRARGDNI